MPGAGTTGVLTKRPRPINAWGSSAGWRDGAPVGHLVLPVPTHVLSADQLSRLASEAGRYRSLVLVLGVGGLRWGEAAALRVSEIDFLRRRVHSHRNAVNVNGTTVVGSLKSNKNRTVVLPAFVVDALSETTRDKGRDDLLWPSATFSRLSRSWCTWNIRAATISSSGSAGGQADSSRRTHP